MSGGVKGHFGNAISNDFFNAFAGRKIGEGIGRTVYRCRIRDDLVVKVETGGCSFQNVSEWETWWAVEPMVHAKWFAPCEAISPCGIVLLQKRTEPVPSGGFPAEVPVFLSDLKPDNFGLLDGRVVCHDYGLPKLLLTHGLSKRTKKVEW